MKIFRSYSSLETKKFGAEIAKRVSSVRHQVSGKRHGIRKHALILALKGDLGTGKTTFTQGFLKGLGVEGRVSSPTFVLMKRFRIHGSGFKNAYHLDCYRIRKPKELLSLGLKEIFENPENIVLVEWPERVSKIMPKKRVSLVFQHGGDKEERAIKVI